jgi:hypothetical protein
VFTGRVGTLGKRASVLAVSSLHQPTELIEMPTSPCTPDPPPAHPILALWGGEPSSAQPSTARLRRSFLFCSPVSLLKVSRDMDPNPRPALPARAPQILLAWNKGTHHAPEH